MGDAGASSSASSILVGKRTRPTGGGQFGTSGTEDDVAAEDDDDVGAEGDAGAKDDEVEDGSAGGRHSPFMKQVT